MELQKDDMIFKPYFIVGEDEPDGWHCVMNTERGRISVRYKGYGLFTDTKRPYEVWYPTETAPDGYQTADDIWDYVSGKTNRV